MHAMNTVVTHVELAEMYSILKNPINVFILIVKKSCVYISSKIWCLPLTFFRNRWKSYILLSIQFRVWEKGTTMHNIVFFS